jgi:hypothetical protein
MALTGKRHVKHLTHVEDRGRHSQWISTHLGQAFTTHAKVDSIPATRQHHKAQCLISNLLLPLRCCKVAIVRCDEHHVVSSEPGSKS